MAGVGSGGCFIAGGRWLLAQGLVWPGVVEATAKGIEALLLQCEIRRRWLAAVLLEGEMHALMASVLLWVAWLDALGLDAELEPPDGETGQSAGSCGGKRLAVVGTDRLGQAVCAKDGFHGLTGMVVVGAGHCLAAEEHTAVSICDGERVAATAV